MRTWRDYEELADRAELVKLIEEYGTPTRIARVLGCSVSSVKNAMKFHEIKSKRFRVGEDTRKLLEL